MNHREDLGMHGRMILKFSLENYDWGMLMTGMIWLRM
jgi:hypothetical protein